MIFLIIVSNEIKPLACYAKTIDMTGFFQVLSLHSDQTIAELMTDGCNMGVKSLNQYLNQYQAADDRSKDLAKRLVTLEERLAVDIRRFL